MELFNKISNDVSKQTTAGLLKANYPYIFSNIRRLSTKFGLRVRVDLVDLGLKEKNQLHFFAGGRFSKMEDKELERLTRECAHTHVLIYEGVISGSCVYNLHKRSDYEKQLEKIKKNAVMPQPEEYVPYKPAEPQPEAPPVAASQFDQGSIAAMVAAVMAAL